MNDSRKKRILCVIGTRPEAIKMAPVVLALRADPNFDVRVLATAQHREMLDQVLRLFDIQPDIDLNVMQANQSLSGLTARLLTGADEVLVAEAPDAVLVQGDTTTVMAMCLACFYRRIPIGHVEAGLRTGDIWNPFPEEANRLIASLFARWHFAPTQSARQNLKAEAIADDRILVTGNTVIDALLMTADRNVSVDLGRRPGARMVLVTAHRRENFGAPFEEICRALQHLAQRNRSVDFVYPVHPNPNVRVAVQSQLAGEPNIRLCAPLEYDAFVAAMKQAHFIISDSGGVQEEAPALGKPVLVLRNETERPEAVDAGVVKLVGPNFERIVAEAQQLLDDPVAYQAMAKGVSPYGDGQAARRIVQHLRASLT